jgi:hypothetical protein
MLFNLPVKSLYDTCIRTSTNISINVILWYQERSFRGKNTGNFRMLAAFLTTDLSRYAGAKLPHVLLHAWHEALQRVRQRDNS